MIQKAVCVPEGAQKTKRRNPNLSRLEMNASAAANETVARLYEETARRAAGTAGVCPVDLTLSYIRLSHAQSCGKCVPCRVGLGQLGSLLEQILDGKANEATLRLLRRTARDIAATADCAIGREAAKVVLDGMDAFRTDYEAHLKDGRCDENSQTGVPCVVRCPANVDIPGYMALVKAGRYADAVKLIRKDNPMVTACAYICEHPCERACRRSLVDSPVNIRGLKRFAVDHAGEVEQPKPQPETGKRVAVIGGGPSGLSCAYYLTLMGHSVTIYDNKKQLGGMLRYGIPAYRFPREKLDAEIASILSVGIEVKLGVKVGADVTLEQLKQEYDCVYLAIGAHSDKKVGIPGEDSKNVMSAVTLLRGIGDGEYPDFTGKQVVVIGGGNVAMDVCRTSLRLGAKKVTCVYRRRQEDMTALAEEVEGALSEGVILKTLSAPANIEADENGVAKCLWAQPQIVGAADKSGRPSPCKADLPEERIPADLIIAAVGQAVESKPFEAEGLPVNRGAFIAGKDGFVADKVYSGGDCVTGPATAIKAIAAGKAAAANIDEYLGGKHEIRVELDIPSASLRSLPAFGRVNGGERDAMERKCDFKDVECGMTKEGACQEASRCLRCDHFGYGAFREGRNVKW